MEIHADAFCVFNMKQGLHTIFPNSKGTVFCSLIRASLNAIILFGYVFSVFDIQYLNIRNSVYINPRFNEGWHDNKEPFVFQHGIPAKSAGKARLISVTKVCIFSGTSNFHTDPLNLDIINTEGNMRIVFKLMIFSECGICLKIQFAMGLKDTYGSRCNNIIKRSR